MLATFFILAAVSCPAPNTRNDSNEAWVPRDKQLLARAKVGCKQFYSENHCLKLFIKKKPQMYQAVCERKQKD